MAISNGNTRSTFKEYKDSHGLAPAIGLKTFEVFSSLKECFFAFAVVGMSIISVYLSWRLGELLNGGTGVVSVYPFTLALMSVMGFYMAGFIFFRGIGFFTRIMAIVWLVALVSLDLFAAWTLFCAADHARTEAADQTKIERLNENIARESKTMAYWYGQAEKTTLFKSSYMSKAEAAKKSRDEYQAKLDKINEETFTAARAVFHKTPIFKDDPEGYMANARLFVALMSVLSPLVGSAFILIHLRSLGVFVGGAPSPNGNRRKKKDRSNTTTQPAITSPTESNPTGARASNDTDLPQRKTFPKPDGERVTAGKDELPTDLEATIEDDEERYQTVKSLIVSGKVTPSNPKIKKLGIGSTNTQRYMKRMRAEGAIERTKNGHKVA